MDEFFGGDDALNATFVIGLGGLPELYELLCERPAIAHHLLPGVRQRGGWREGAELMYGLCLEDRAYGSDPREFVVASVRHVLGREPSVQLIADRVGLDDQRRDMGGAGLPGPGAGAGAGGAATTSR